MQYYEIPGVSDDQLDILRRLHHRLEEETSGQRNTVANRVLVDLAHRAINDGIKDADTFEERLEEGLRELENIRSGLVGNLRYGSITAKSAQIPELKRLIDNIMEKEKLEDIILEGKSENEDPDSSVESENDGELADYEKKEDRIKAMLDKRAFFVDFDPMLFRADEFHLNPVDCDALTDATKRYIEQPWLQSPMLDWFLINGFLRSHLDGYLEGIFTGSLFGGVKNSV